MEGTRAREELGLAELHQILNVISGQKALLGHIRSEGLLSSLRWHNHHRLEKSHCGVCGFLYRMKV